MARTAIQIRVKGILSFPALIEPKAISSEGDSGKKRYSTQVLIAKSDKGFPKTAGIFMQDGVEYNEGREARGKDVDPRLNDYIILSVNTGENYAPTVLNPHRNPATQADVWSGQVAWVAFSVYSYKEPKVGIAAGLNGVLLTGNVGALGRLDGKPDAAQLFGDISDDELAPAELAQETTAPVGAGEGEFSV